MAQRLRLDVIPEGIEKLDQLYRLRAIGCQLGQGFLLSPAVSADLIEAMLTAPTPFPHIRRPPGGGGSGGRGGLAVWSCAALAWGRRGSPGMGPLRGH
jgi:predicted signal transduction protein with EAL and GGDEF domain